MRLKCKSSTGTFLLGKDLELGSKFSLLKTEISQATGIPVDRMQLVKIGYPPVTISGTTIKETGIKDGEQIIVETKSVDILSREQQSAEQNVEKETTHTQPIQNLVPPLCQNNLDPFSKDEEYMVVREMKDDNSCLFRSIAYTCLRDAEMHHALRKIAVEAIKNDPFNFSEVVLGSEPLAYCDWISKPSSWGGAIELSIFSEHFKTEIACIDVQSQRVDLFGEGKFDQRIFVLYSGIHYDAIALTPSKGVSQEFDQTIFRINDSKTPLRLQKAIEVAGEWRKKRKFTDLANFTLKCSQCKIGLKGQSEAQEHAQKTGHTQFSEY